MPAAIFEAVLGNLAVAAGLAAVALAAGRWLNRPAVAHVLWLLVLVKLLTPPVVTIPVRCLPAKADPGAAVEPATSPTPSVVPQPVVVVEPDPPAAPVPQSAAVVPVATGVIPPAPIPAPALPATALSLRLPSWDVALLTAWAVGTVVAAGLALRRVRRFARLLNYAAEAPAGLVADVAVVARRMGLRSPLVRVVPGGIAPLVWAVGRPTLYFPAGLLDRLTAEQRFALIAHELAHLRRWDHVVRVIEFAALAVYWWCPLAWLARREFRRLEEEACDAEVTAADPESGFAYASAILETIDFLAGVAPAPAFASGIGDVRSLRRRLTLILEGHRPPPTSARVRLGLLVVAVVVLTAGPKLTRLTAAVIETASRDVGRPIVAPVTLPTLDEPQGEAIHFLPTPTRLAGLPEVGSSYHAAAISPDGARLAIADGSRVLVWDLAAKRVLFTLAGHGEAVNAVAFSPDGSRIATAGNDGVAILWDAADGRHLHTLTGHGTWVLAATFSPDGRTLATGGYDKTVRLWDVTTGEPRATWTGHAAGVRSVAFSPDGRTVATGGADHEVRVWDAARGVTIHTLKRHTAAVRVVAFSPDGARLASGSEDRTLQLWNPADGREVGPALPLPDFATAVRFSPRGQTLFVGTLGGHLLNVNPATGQLRGYVGVEAGRPAATPAHADAVTAVLLPPDGSSLYTVSQDRAVLSWPSAGPPQTPRTVFRSGHPVNAVALSPDGRLLATGGQDGVIHLWDAAAVRELATLPGHPGGVTALVFAAGGRLVSAGADERVRVWDLAAGRAVRTVIQPTADLRIALSPDGRTLAIGGRKLPGVALLKLESAGPLRWVGRSVGEVTAVAFTPAGDRLATGYASGVVRLWDVASGEEFFRTSVGTGSVDVIAFHPNGAAAAVVLNGSPQPDGEVGPAHDVVFWDPRDGSLRDAPRPLSHPGPLTAAAFANGNVLTAAHDGNLYLWDPAAARVLRTIRGHSDAVRGVALAADGSAFSAGDRAAKRWPLAREN
jgi:WD40 repeat protein/beta-lactamase regulating signal transducer with metallopeptidase domain